MNQPSFSRNTHQKSQKLTSLSTLRFSKPADWLLYTASIAPLICGAVGPTVTLFALSGCVDEWGYINLPDGLIIKEKDPTWVVATTVTALLIGFLANILLLVRLLGRGESNYTVHLSIILWILQGRPCLRYSSDNSPHKHNYHRDLC